MTAKDTKTPHHYAFSSSDNAFHADILFISSNISSMLAIEKDKVY
jgi:hypothetical protein